MAPWAQDAIALVAVLGAATWLAIRFAARRKVRTCSECDAAPPRRPGRAHPSSLEVLPPGS